MAESAKTIFWATSPEEALTRLGGRPEGLSSEEVERQRARYGENVAVAPFHRTLLARVLKKLTDPLVAILLIAAAVSGGTGDWSSVAIIVVIVLFSIALDVVQEQKAEHAVEALKRSVAVTAAVRRNGHVVALPVRELVPGDVVELRAGDLVPADGVLLTARGALADEAILTGEPYAVEKRPAPGSGNAGTQTADAFNALFGGTSLVGGEATMLVMATGPATRFGAIAASVQEKVVPSAFERGVHGLGVLILRLTGFLVLFVLLTQLVRVGLSLEAFLFAVALAVGLTPELLPMVMTVTLARGALRMAGKKVVVKRLSAIHDLGAMDVLCTDKTGTLTEAKIALVGALAPDGSDSPSVAALARRNSAFCGGMRSNLDDAILSGVPEQAGWAHLDDLPFDFERRRAAVLVEGEGARQMVVKGAPEAVLALSTGVARADGTVAPMDAAARAGIAAVLEEKGRAGFRLLGVAFKSMPQACGAIALADEGDLVFAGCVVFVDPPKASAGEAVARLGAAGVRVKIVSGDAEPVVRHLVETLGLPATGVLTGAEIEDMAEAALVSRVAEADLFVRISPDQKMRIVRALRLGGATVGFMGDGINDAPAIHAADVGLSVEGGTDVAREAADIILLAADLNVLADGVAEGRRTYANIMKYVRMGTSSNFGNMLSMALASLVLPFLPLAPLQILLNNLIYDLSEIGIPFDKADPEELARPRRWDMGEVLRFTLIMGPLSSVFDIATFALLRLGFSADMEVFRTAWFVESIATQILVIFVIRTVRAPWASRAHPILALTSLGALAAALALALGPFGGWFGFAPLPASLLAALAGLTLAYLVCAQLLKPLAMRPSPHAGRWLRGHLVFGLSGERRRHP